MSIDSRVGYTLGALISVLIIAEVARFSLRRRQSARELSQRIRSWWVIVLICAIALIVSPVVVLVLLAFVSYLALKEYVSIAPTRMTDRAVLLVAYLAIPTQWWWIGAGHYGMFIIWVPVYLFVLVPSIMVLRGETEGFLRALGTLHWGLMLCVFSIGHIAYLFMLPGNASEGARLLLTLLVLTQGNDVAQYVWGKVAGRHRIAPAVSPNKTVEGFAGGLITTVALAALIGPFLTPMSLPMSVLAGFLLAVSGFLGDLTVSAVKRDIGIKDTGSLIPGHGGVLDRVDSLVFAAPLFFHFMRYFYF
jgi:phosphatidate cytidylyltransferase